MSQATSDVSSNPQTSPLLPGWSLAAQHVIETGRRAYGLGWLPATSGNLSVRAANGVVAITRSGVDKGALELADILRQPLGDDLLAGSSAEAALHMQLYRDNPAIGAVFHTHGQAASVLGRIHQIQGEILLEGWELQKALAGIRTHETRVVVPVFPNTQDIEALAHQVSSLFAGNSDGATRAPGYVIAGHGLYAWGSNTAQAWRHLEALDALLTQTLALRR